MMTHPQTLEELAEILKEQDKDRSEKHAVLQTHIDDIAKKLDGFVTYKVFFWVMGVIVVVFGWIITSNMNLQSQVQSSIMNQNQTLVQLSQIQTDLQWVKLNLKK